MTLSKEQKFLYTRIAILVLFVLAIGSAVAGLNGFPFWYGVVVLCFWGALGLLNYGQHSSVWLLYKKPWFFALFYGALASVSFLVDTFGLNAYLWFYPFYHGLGLLWVWLILYPFSGLAMLELLYFLAGYLDEPLRFRAYPLTKGHRFFDMFESILFLGVVATVVLGAMKSEWGLALPYMIGIAVCWMLTAFVKLRFHIRHPGQYLLVFVVTVLLATLAHGVPNIMAREWVYFETHALNFLMFGIPAWVWLGLFGFTLMTLRLWIFLVLHPKVR